MSLRSRGIPDGLAVLSSTPRYERRPFAAGPHLGTIHQDAVSRLFTRILSLRLDGKAVVLRFGPMHYQYKEQKTGGNLELWAGDAGLKRVPFGKDTHYQLTIAWNRGPAQRIYVDDIGYELPEDGLALLVVAHTFYFDRPEDIVAWGFNRDFYCVIDHDQEVSCAGFIFYGFPNPMILAPDENTVRKISLLLPVFTDEFKDNDNLQGEMLRMLLKRLIVIITRTAKKQLLPEDTLAPEYDLSRQFSLLVEQNFRDKHQVADYAALLFKSPKTLSNVFHKLGGNSPLQFIHERIVLEGRRLLLYTDKPVAEIADELGFLESGHFSRMFKRVTGDTPTALRA